VADAYHIAQPTQTSPWIQDWHFPRIMAQVSHLQHHMDRSLTNTEFLLREKIITLNSLTMKGVVSHSAEKMLELILDEFQ